MIQDGLLTQMLTSFTYCQNALKGQRQQLPQQYHIFMCIFSDVIEIFACARLEIMNEDVLHKKSFKKRI